MILAVIEHDGISVRKASWEAVAAARRAGRLVGAPVALLVLGTDLAAVSAEAATGGDPVYVVDDPGLAAYSSDAYAHGLGQVLNALHPSLVVMAHTYQARDYAPIVAARRRVPLITDVVGVSASDGVLEFSRPMFQGKLEAVVRPVGNVCVITSQVGSFRVEPLAGRGEIVSVPVDFTAFVSRQTVEPPFREGRQTVDLGQAERIVAVGRGVRSQAHLPMVRALAEALDAELAASRPVCDSGWLPMDRQVGSSGHTVAPRLYLALGISGAIQHLVGMKASQTIVAVNTDPDAPIFEVADYGIVGDLVEVVPALTTALQRRPR